jgi:hypothetical protein
MLSIVIVVTLLVWSGDASQLYPVSKSPCLALGNGSVWDISHLFEYPVTLDGPIYKYTWSPCQPLPPSLCEHGPGNRWAESACSKVKPLGWYRILSLYPCDSLTVLVYLCASMLIKRCVGACTARVVGNPVLILVVSPPLLSVHCRGNIWRVVDPSKLGPCYFHHFFP